MMESQNGAALEDEKCVVVEGNRVEESDKGVKNADLLGESVKGNPESAKVNEGKDSSVVAVKASVTVPSKNSKTAKESGAAKSGKAVKEKPLKMTNPRVALSQSLSFPARGGRVEGMKKSVDGLLVKREARENGPKPGPNGTVSSVKTGPHRRASVASVQTKEESKTVAAPSRRATLSSSIPSFKHTAAKKLVPVTETADAPSSEPPLVVEKDLAPVKTKLIKEEDDAISTASTGTPRSRKSALAFASRLDERAAKRKEFFSKLEEKIQAKEVEKTTLQEKSKESREAEIKQLRKSMTFKATPMPVFYREPLPKVELKKIPTTRAKSPKLGRTKNPEANGSSESVATSSPRVKLNPNTPKTGSEKDAAESKKAVVRKSQHKLHSQEKAEAKSVKSTMAKPAGKARKTQNEDLPQETVSETNGNVNRDGESAETNHPGHEIMPQEVAVGV